ncbi:Methyltransferase domain-containing protein [Bifidobacterium margollesii]|uniref:site-specific DNA-methyltransferase (adenine-specific) n=1 Tax=Bifidobacterium margollesii TaxID=2020964 RepID=A0A2N5J7S0_9BIFI|nr:BREX-1 system adenine-specific DNA-methyltransferase PglX [Bifidobacterium margollesii]PLS30250.1 Methyltransferase domain-containing protein [Bifidobacterium margollesii]
MNTSRLQAFAAGARVELMKAVRAKLDAALERNSAAQSDNPRAYESLLAEIKRNGGGEHGRAKTVERHAYRWFNRIIALRYMDANEFTSVHVVSGDEPDNPNALPAVLSAARRGEFDEDVFDSNIGVRAKVLPTIQALLNGSKPSSDPQGDAYALLLRAYCDYWHRFLPFMFDDAGDADEILMPSDLLARDSVLRKAVEAMSVEDCVGERGEGAVEIIGWLYQFYIADRKDEVMAGFKKSRKAGADEIPAATQLFTPDWIVQYLVQNTVGRLWTQNHPESQLYKNWEYFILPPSDDGGVSEADGGREASAQPTDEASNLAFPYEGKVAAQPTDEASNPVFPYEGKVAAQPTDEVDAGLAIATPEDLTVCDPACGSGHMLTYAFDLLYDIYDEAGYSANEIPGLILKHNLFGMEIDERAANLAAFALTMKARGKYRRFFRKGRQVQPNIQRITREEFTDEEVSELNELYDVTLDADTWNTYQHADVYGSLIQPDSELSALAFPSEGKVSAKPTDEVESALFTDDFINHEELARKAHTVLTQTAYLARQYAAVVANPPYMGSSNMGAELKQYVNDHYKDGKSDLFAAFILRNLQLIQPNALLGMITMQSWMFLSSFEELRKNLLAKHSIETMAHLGSGAFDSIGGEVVSTTAFTIRNGASDGKGTYLRLVDVQGDDNQAAACAEAVGSPLRGELSAKPTEGSESSVSFTVNQHDFAQIPGSPIVYWLSEAMRNTFTMGKPLEEVAKPRQGLATADNNRFIREWWEVNQSRSSFDCTSHEEAAANGKRWFPYNKGGDFRKWYGNQDYLINWENDGKEIDDFRPRSVVRNPSFYFHDSVSWSNVTSGVPSFRYYPSGFIFSHVGDCLFGRNESQNAELLAFSNSSVTDQLLQSIAPTLHFEVGQIATLPFADSLDRIDTGNVKNLISTSKADWDSYETSWDFTGLDVLGYPSVGCADSSPDKRSEEERSGAGSPDKGSLSVRIPAFIAHCKQITEEQREREIRNNELVADAYGVRDEVPCDVPIERVSLKRNPAFAYPKATPAERDELMARDLVKEIISYAVGCMFGRYSLDKPGLILASQGETLDDYHDQIPNPTFEPDADNVIPVTDEEWFEDDLAARFRTFLGVALGERHLAENIAYIEQVLGKPLRKYFVNDFYDDHVRMYRNRPIYWMYSSRTDKKGSFKALVYLHRYTPATTNNVLVYLRDFAVKLHAQSERLLESSKASEVRKGEKLQAAIRECADYERDILYPLATRNLPLDLDDGVLVNYLRLGKALRTIPALEKKRKTVQSWTWPTHPLGE